MTELQLEVTQSKLMVENKEEEMEKMTEELNAVKKVRVSIHNRLQRKGPTVRAACPIMARAS